MINVSTVYFDGRARGIQGNNLDGEQRTLSDENIQEIRVRPVVTKLPRLRGR